MPVFSRLTKQVVYLSICEHGDDIMSQYFNCPECGHKVLLSLERCPTCGRPGFFSNVIAAETPAEHLALTERYEIAKQKMIASGSENTLQSFQDAIAGSTAVMARSLIELHRLVSSDQEVYSTYYKLIDSGIRLPEGRKWDVLRSLTDTALFPNYKEQIRFAALSLTDTGLLSFGDCFITLRTEMIAHRATVFEENSILFMKHHNINLWSAANLPRGFRATWKDRALLCVAKLHGRLLEARDDEYARILLEQGSTSEEDQFVEVHIWGPMTIRTVSNVTLTEGVERDRMTAPLLASLREKLVALGIEVRN